MSKPGIIECPICRYHTMLITDKAKQHLSELHEPDRLDEALMKQVVEDRLRHDCNCDLAADVKTLQQKVAYLEALTYQLSGTLHKRDQVGKSMLQMD